MLNGLTVKYKIYKSILAFSLVGVLFSCENDLETIKTVTATDESPDEIVNHMHTLYSDSGVVNYEIIATRVEKFGEPKDITVFKDGFTVNFYKAKDSIVSKLTADYGEMRDREKLIIAKNNVIFTNYDKNQTLKTEELYWDQKEKRVKTDKQFNIIGDKTEVWGYGLDTDENFTDYNAHKVRVETIIENDTINE
ncbi:LPS export ABC transporter periplasmic protein LptC [Crocinitomix algicola]|uniref:LPS export ABC transporter periplasmic protein LptC n=1 Tax=Crocinitomix algicola TaxID=1740263 RepID=UPI00082E28A9|nr:LPS export ABC transporter periplasmic protein LptC [Crocinitomix algicola]